MNNLDRERARLNYEKKSGFGKFIHAYTMAIKMGGLRAIIGYPLAYWEISRMLKKGEKEN